PFVPASPRATGRHAVACGTRRRGAHRVGVRARRGSRQSKRPRVSQDDRELSALAKRRERGRHPNHPPSPAFASASAARSTLPARRFPLGASRSTLPPRRCPLTLPPHAAHSTLPASRCPLPAARCPLGAGRWALPAARWALPLPAGRCPL